jgi:hypothetical protein
VRFNPNTPCYIRELDGVKMAGWPMHQQVTKVLLAEAVKLGYRCTKLPDAGLPPMDIQGVRVWVDPIPEKVMVGRTGESWTNKMVRPFKLRVQSICPQCQWVGAFGRFHQHTCRT